MNARHVNLLYAAGGLIALAITIIGLYLQWQKPLTASEQSPKTKRENAKFWQTLVDWDHDSRERDQTLRKEVIRLRAELKRVKE